MDERELVRSKSPIVKLEAYVMVIGSGVRMLVVTLADGTEFQTADLGLRINDMVSCRMTVEDSNG